MNPRPAPPRPAPQPLGSLGGCCRLTELRSYPERLGERASREPVVVVHHGSERGEGGQEQLGEGPKVAIERHSEDGHHLSDEKLGLGTEEKAGVLRHSPEGGEHGGEYNERDNERLGDGAQALEKKPKKEDHDWPFH